MNPLLVKSFLELIAVASGIAFLVRSARRKDILILAYHNVVPDDQPSFGEESLHLKQSAFGKQLDLLTETHDVLPLEELYAPIRISMNTGGFKNRLRRRPRAVITFDDAYRGALTVGLQELSERQLPATMFVAPGCLGDKTFWWDVLTRSDEHSISRSLRELALTKYAGKNDIIVKELVGPTVSVNGECPDHTRSVAIEELHTVLEYEQLTLGSHSWSHPNLQQLDGDELTTELQKPKTWLREQFGDRVLPVVSYPYGRADRKVWKKTKEIGYKMGLMIDGGWAKDPIPNRHSVPRINIPSGLSDRGFLLRTSGVLTT